MICPKCHYFDTKVYDTRLTNNRRSTRRRRECQKCQYRFTTLEEVKILDLYVEKRNGQTELFSEQKLEKGILKAFNKRNVNKESISALVQKTMENIMEIDKNPIKSTKIGKLVLKNLKETDEVAYICYWAMFGNFETAEEFNKLLKEVQKD